MQFYKVMFTVKGEPVIWDCLTETTLPVNHPVYRILDKYIILPDWEANYDKLYHEWLNNDDETIYNINADINKGMIDAIVKVNQVEKDRILYYWFDVNRDMYPNFNWIKCPLSSVELTTTANQFHKNNRKISSAFPLIFPDQLI